VCSQALHFRRCRPPRQPLSWPADAAETRLAPAPRKRGAGCPAVGAQSVFSSITTPDDRLSAISWPLKGSAGRRARSHWPAMCAHWPHPQPISTHDCFCWPAMAEGPAVSNACVWCHHRSAIAQPPLVNGEIRVRRIIERVAQFGSRCGIRNGDQAGLAAPNATRRLAFAMRCIFMVNSGKCHDSEGLEKVFRKFGAGRCGSRHGLACPQTGPGPGCRPRCGR